MSNEIPDRPEFLDDDFLKTCIRSLHFLDNNSNVQINDVALSYVVPKGENFMSVMYRAEVTYQLEKGQVLKNPFIVKVSHDMEAMARSSSMLCDIEIDMYVNYVPKLDQLFKEKGVKTQFACRYFHTLDVPKVIVFEDLKPLGFVMADRIVGEDLKHCKVVYNKIAQFHAAGMCYFYNQPDEVKAKYAKSGFEIVLEDQQGHTIAQKRRIVTNVIELEKHNNKYVKAIDFFKKFSDILDSNKLPSTPNIPGSKFNTLTHTDLHVNNMMFKYNQDGSIADFYLVDLQACHYTSVVFDFLFFFITSTSLEVRKNNFEELKRWYFDALVKNLILLEYKGDIPTLQEFEKEISRNTISAMFPLTFMLPGIVQTFDEKMKSREKSKAFTMDELSQMSTSALADQNYSEKMLATVDILQRSGCMDKSPEELL